MLKMQAVIIVLTIMLLQSCSLVGVSNNEPVKLQRYEITLSENLPQNLLQNGPSITVYPVQTNARFNSTRMAYSLSPHEISYYAQSEWADTPGNMLLPLLVNGLENSGKFASVVSNNSSVITDYALDVSLLELMHYIQSDKKLFTLQVRLQLLDLHKRTVLGTETINIEQIVTDHDAYGAVLAANQSIKPLIEKMQKFVGLTLQ